MSDDKIITLVPNKKDETLGKDLEAHSYIKSFLNYDDADAFADEVIEKYDLDIYFIGQKDIRRIRGAYQALVSIHKRQGELFNYDD